MFFVLPALLPKTEWPAECQETAGRHGPPWALGTGLPLHALGACRHVVEGQRHRHTGVKAHQADHVGNALMTEHLDRAIEETLGDPARIREAGRHLIDDLLALVVERGR